MSGLGLGFTSRNTWRMLSEWAYIHQLRYAQELDPSHRSVDNVDTAASGIVPRTEQKRDSAKSMGASRR